MGRKCNDAPGPFNFFAAARVTRLVLKTGGGKAGEWESDNPGASSICAGRGYLRRSFFVRTLNFTVGRFAVEANRVLLRRRRRSRRASAEKKCRTIHATEIAAMTPKITSAIRLPKFMEVYLAHAVGM